MDRNISSGSNSPTRAIVHLKRGMQRRETSPVHVEASRVEKPSRILPLSDRCTEQCCQYARTYIPEIPAIVLDIEM